MAIEIRFEIAPSLLPGSVLVMFIFFAVVGLCIFVYMKTLETDKIVDDEDYDEDYYYA